MKLLIDMNLSPTWSSYFASAGVDSIHWSEVGAFDEKDAVLMQWARENGYCVFTHDLDFSALIATTGARGPSVLQVRTQDVLPEAIGSVVLRVIQEHADALSKGAIVTLDELAARVRILPIRRDGE